MLKVTFDSNVWEKIVTPGDTYNDLLRWIRDETIAPFITRISISMESIRKRDRLSFVKDYEPEYTVEDIPSAKGSIGIRIGIGPNNAAHPPLHEKLSQNIIRAHECGFRVLPMTNLATPRVTIPEGMERIPTDFNTYAEDLGDFSDYLMNMGCGGAQYFHYKECIQNGAKVDEKSFSESLAEWVDGDSLAAHYASKNDIFCTEDHGGNAGVRSVFHPNNCQKVTTRYHIRVMDVAELRNALKLVC